MDDKDLYAGLIRLHILHHAVTEGPVYGLWMIEELARHGYRLSAGTLYPILHGLERKGYLASTEERVGSRTRRVYRATPTGAEALATAKQRVWELFGELFEPRDAAAWPAAGEAGAEAAGPPPTAPVQREIGRHPRRHQPGARPSSDHAVRKRRS
jgi:DNA-binding PadR family transcriptional regulator